MYAIAIVSKRGTPITYLTKNGKWWQRRFARLFEDGAEAFKVLEAITPDTVQSVVEENGLYDVGGVQIVKL